MQDATPTGRPSSHQPYAASSADARASDAGIPEASGPAGAEAGSRPSSGQQQQASTPRGVGGAGPSAQLHPSSSTASHVPGAPAAASRSSISRVSLSRVSFGGSRLPREPATAGSTPDKAPHAATGTTQELLELLESDSESSVVSADSFGEPYDEHVGALQRRVTAVRPCSHSVVMRVARRLVVPALHVQAPLSVAHTPQSHTPLWHSALWHTLLMHAGAVCAGGRGEEALPGAAAAGFSGCRGPRAAVRPGDAVFPLHGARWCACFVFL